MTGIIDDMPTHTQTHEYQWHDVYVKEVMVVIEREATNGWRVHTMVYHGNNTITLLFEREYVAPTKEQKWGPSSVSSSSSVSSG